jgi:hypothetical protein
MKALTAALLIVAGIAGPAAAGGYSLANRPSVAFPAPYGGAVHVSPYPMSKRAASVWASDSCWRDCTGQAAWRFESCIGKLGPQACRSELDADDRACLRWCRTRGGPLLNITD